MKKFIFILSVALMTLFFISCGDDNNNTSEPKIDDNKKNESVISNLVSKLTLKEFSNSQVSMEAIFNFDYDKSNRIEEINVDHYALDGQSGATSSTKTKIEVEFEYTPSRIVGKQIDINEKGIKTSEITINTILDESNKARSSEINFRFLTGPSEEYTYKDWYKYDKNKNIEEVISSNNNVNFIYKYELKWVDGNPTYISYNNTIYNYSYGNILNNSNIDLNLFGAILSSEVVAFAQKLYMMNLDLIKSKNLAESYSKASEDVTYTNKFELDKDNRVVKITTFSTKGESKEAKKVREIAVSYK